MFNNVALDVVIGLVFIYLLYSLFATVLGEIIAVKLGLRARNLKEAIDRMLNDEQPRRSFIRRFIDSSRLMKNPKNPRVVNFYNHPEIKYMGSTGIFRNPSSFKAGSFSKTLLFMLNEIGYKKLTEGNTQMENQHEGDIKRIPVTPVTRERVETALSAIIREHAGDQTGKDKIVLDAETAKYVLSLWYESNGDLARFRSQLEQWFDRTMEQATEWYKRKIQMVLMVLGLFIAWSFNVDTFEIVGKLSTDKTAREQMVTLAAAYIESHPELPKMPTGADKSDSLANEQVKQKLDSLLAIKKELSGDIQKANSVLGNDIKWWLPDTMHVHKHSARLIFNPSIDSAAFVSLKGMPEKIALIKDGEDKAMSLDYKLKWSYIWHLWWRHFWGYLITAIAISLGAPFWFDLLNKLMKLRTSIKQGTDKAETTPLVAEAIPANRVG